MESGFGQNLEGFLIKGNLSLAPSASPSLHGDGSIEGSGTLYFDIIREYNQYNGINIQDVQFKNGQLLVPYTIPSSNLTSASVIIDGGMSVKHTQNSTSITSGGGLTVAGGASFGKDVNIGGVLNLNNKKIINVADPSDGKDGVNKDYVDSVATKVSGNFTTGQVIIADSNGDAIRGYDFFNTDLSQVNLSIPLVISNTSNANGTTGALNVSGGVNISKDLLLNGLININGNKIINLDYPIDNQDGANKKYVDDRISTISAGSVSGNFTQGQLIVGDSGGTLIGYNTLTYDGSILTLNSTRNNAFVCYGGLSISKDVFVGGTLNVNNNNLLNVAYPINGSDGVNKDYVDNQIANIFNTSGTGLTGNFSAGQLLVANTNGTSLRGYDNLKFVDDGTFGNLILNDNTNFYIANTTDSTGLSDGSFMTLGGASFNKSVFIGGQLDVNQQRITNVSYPYESFDGVNKAYVDGLFNELNSCCTDPISENIYEETFVLNNNVTIPEDINTFNVDNSIKAFIANVYINVNDNNTTNSFYTIYGVNKGTEWCINTNYIGKNTDIKFYIKTDVDVNGIIQYTNTNLTGTTTIKYSIINQVNDITTPCSNQSNLELLNNTVTYTDLSELTFLNDRLNANKVIVYISNESENKYSLFFLNCLLKNNEWVLESYFTGDVTGIHFRIFSDNNVGKIQYINNNTNGIYNIRIQQFKIYKYQNTITLFNNTLTYQNIDPNFVFSNTVNNFKLTLYVEIVESSKFALYEIQGFVDDGEWKINSKFIGDRTGIIFNIDTVSNFGYLTYTNPNIYDAKIKFIKNVPLLFEPLSVSNGGTGNIEFTQYSVLRGDGTNPIIGTSDFIYKDYQLTLGTASSILITNTSPAVSLISGNSTFTTNGGAIIKKNLIVGDSLVVKEVDVTPSVGDIVAERVFYASNDVNTPSNIDGYNFINVNIKSFFGLLCATIVTDSDELDTLYELRGLKKKSGWILNTSYIGDYTNIKLSITSNGQVQYTTPNIPNWVSTIFKFKAMTTTYQITS
jgi:hypothetical protein